MSKRERVAIVGAGHVGATTAFALMLRALFREIVLIDNNQSLAAAEAADLCDANALARPARIWAGDCADAASASIAILTAGAATHGAQDRLSVASQSAAVIASCVRQLAENGFAGIILVAANPVDLMALVASRHAGLPVARIIGTGTLLDTSRLHQTLAAHLNVAPGSVEGFVIGEHGDSEVAAFSTVRIGGTSLSEFQNPKNALNLNDVATHVRQAAYGIVSGKGFTSFGVATAIVRICEAIVRDEKAALPVSAMLTGQYDISGVFLSLPCILGGGGIERILTPALSGDELIGLHASAKVLQRADLELSR